MGKSFVRLLVILCLLFNSCPEYVHSANAASMTVDASLQLGIDRYHRGDQQEALSLLRGFVIRNDNSPDLPLAYLYLARIFQLQGRHQEALLYTGRISADRKGPESLLIEGVSQVTTGQYQIGLSTLLNIDPESLNGADRARRNIALAQAHAGLGHYLEALTCIHRSGEPDGSAVYELAHRILRDNLTPVELAEATFMFRDTAIGQDVLLQQAEKAADHQDQTLFSMVMENPTPFPFRQEATVLGEELNYFPALQRSIGVMLPLSGRYATFGQLVQRGMELAAELHNQNTPQIRLLFRDSGTSAEESRRIVAEFAADPEVMAIAGPLTGGAAAAAAETAQQLRIPLFTLSPRDGLPEFGPFVFRNSLTTLQQVQTLVSYAMDRLGLTTFGILHPENKLGYEMTDLFIREVQTQGGQIIATQMYSEKATDYRRQVKLLRGENPNTPDSEPAETDPGGRLAKDKAPFQALFIPDYADKISMIAPQLIFYGIGDVQLFGINGWNSPDLIRTTGRYLQGAVFVDGFYRAGADPAIRQFVEDYLSKYGEEPSILEAQGFDVLNMLLLQLHRPEIHTRAQLQAGLLQLRNFSGVSGNTSIAASGEAIKPLFLLRVNKSSLVEID
jgi:ABC-type branched-subunit amino acid transport system substrate-binding protein